MQLADPERVGQGGSVIALGVVLVVAWDGFCLRDLIRADPATVRYLGKGTWAFICLLSCPWGGLLYVIAGRGGFGRVLRGRGQPPGGQ